MGRPGDGRAGGGCAAVTGAFCRQHGQLSVPPGTLCPEHSGAVPHLQPQEKHIPTPGLGDVQEREEGLLQLLG